MAESIGNIIPTQVPSYTEAADIRKAFNLYHYGTETVPSTTVGLSGMAGYINSLQEQITALEAGISSVTQLGPTQNLNDMTTPGIYFSTSAPTSALGYPIETAGNSDLGYLLVNKSGNYVFQAFQTVGDTTRSSNVSDLSLVPKFFFRSGVLVSGVVDWGVGNSWMEAANASHAHNDLYYTKAQVDARVDLPENLVASRAAIVNSAGKVTASTSITQTELEQLDGIDITKTIQDQLDDKAALVHVHDDRYYVRSDVNLPSGSPAKKTVRVFVQPGEPTGANVGDLWFY
jgi:hypothetical protein